MKKDPTPFWRYPSLTRGQVIKVARVLRAQGRKLPRLGWCVTVGKMPNGRCEVCRDNRGLYAIPGGCATGSTLGRARRATGKRRR